MAVPITRTQRNVLANVAAQGGTSLLAIACIPLHIHFLGIEAFGLVGFYSSLLATFSLLDLGLSTAVNRELARLSASPGSAGAMRQVVRGVQRVYWGVALVLGGGTALLAPWITRYWLHGASLSPGAVLNAVVLMGFALAFQWPLAFYSAGVMGLQRQVLLSAVNLVMALFRFAGVVPVLWLISPTIQAYFIWQIGVSAAHTSVVAAVLWSSLPAASGAPPQGWKWSGVSRFATGMSGISLTVLILTQSDKIVLSATLPLAQFGYYTLAGTVAAGLTCISGPLHSALFPRFAQLVYSGSRGDLSELYHHSCQLMSVLVLPAAAFLAVFSHELLFVWTGNAETAENAGVVLTLLAVGLALNSLYVLPYTLQLAFGWTRLALCSNLIAVLLLTPSLLVLAPRYGGPGAASLWIVLNGGYLLFSLPIMHRRLLPGEQWRWYLEDVGWPLTLALLGPCLGRWLLVIPSSRPGAAATLAGLGFATFATAFLGSPLTRRWLLHRLATVKHRYFSTQTGE
jgi:O-antigen/teichoic acid export membrane protein